MNRRQFLQGTAAIGLATLLSNNESDAAEGDGILDVTPFRASVRIKSVELLRTPGPWFVRVTSADGAVGLATTSERIDYCYPLLTKRVAPYFVNKDARILESLVDGIYTHESNYKLAGLPFWCAVAWVEFAVLDLLGQIAKKPVGDLLGGVLRRQIPVYVSSLRRDTTPEQEVEWVGKRLAETGATAVKLKIGGRMSRNADASPGRTDRLVLLARKTFGDKIAIYVDANGSYDSKHAIGVGRMLEEHNIGFYEEPCPWEEYAETKRVADALKITIAGGEQDSSLHRLRDMIEQRIVDLPQPDVTYNGGLIRTIRVAQMAQRAGLSITPHSPKSDPNEAYMLHFAARTPNIGPHQEFNGAPSKPADWFEPAMIVRDGMMTVPTGPGLGITIDPALLAKADVVK